jgi:TIR domain
MIKQMVFLSHAHQDQHTANVLEGVIQRAFPGGLEVVNSSNRKSISLDDPWRNVFMERLCSSRTLLVLATPESVSSPWVNFEAGGAWISENRVIPCCAKGMTPSSLPAPLRHLQALDLASSDDLRTLIKQLSDAADLDAPSEFDYQEAVTTIVGSWQRSIEYLLNKEFIQYIKRIFVRLEKYKGQTCQGFVKMSHLSAVTPLDARQFSGENILAGDSVRCWLAPVGETAATLYHCFANGPVASALFEVDPRDIIELTLKCLGQFKAYESTLGWGDEEKKLVTPRLYSLPLSIGLQFMCNLD